MKLLWSERHGNDYIGYELYVFYAGQIIYKRWYKGDSNEKRLPSKLFQTPWTQTETLPWNKV
jgi:hypothetical protein